MSDAVDQEPGLVGKRARQRDSLLLMGTIRAVGDYARETQPIRVRNLSATGLMADSHANYDPGSSVEIGLRGIGLVDGEVAWVRGGQIGVTFRETVDPRRARRRIDAKSDEHLRKIVPIGVVRRPGLRID